MPRGRFESANSECLNDHPEIAPATLEFQWIRRFHKSAQRGSPGAALREAGGCGETIYLCPARTGPSSDSVLWAFSFPGRYSGVSTRTTTANMSTASVGASDYQVIVTTSGPAWVQSSYPLPHMNAVPGGWGGLIPTAQTRSYPSVPGKLSLQVGSVQLQVEVQVHGRTVSGGRIVPPKAPYTWIFSSVA
jgi:hypothetical protein